MNKTNDRTENGKFIREIKSKRLTLELRDIGNDIEIHINDEGYNSIHDISISKEFSDQIIQFLDERKNMVRTEVPIQYSWKEKE